jgi:hypothetical protein
VQAGLGPPAARRSDSLPVGGIPAGTHRTPAALLKLGLSHAAMVPDLTMRDGAGAAEARDKLPFRSSGEPKTPPMTPRRRAEEGAAPGLGGTSPTPLPGLARHAQPGSILYASWVNKMSLAGARLAAPTSAQAGSLSER